MVQLENLIHLTFHLLKPILSSFHSLYYILYFFLFTSHNISLRHGDLKVLVKIISESWKVS